MVENKAQTAGPVLIDRRWVGLVYGVFALALLGLAALQRADALAHFPVALGLLCALLVATPLTAALVGRAGRTRWPLVLPVLLIDACAALGLVAATGGYASPMWVALLLVSTAAPLLLPGRWAVALLGLVWLADGLFLLAAPPALLPEASLAWSLKVAGVALTALVLQRALVAEEGLRKRAQRRERVLTEFLHLSNRLRVTSEPPLILEEVARAVQAAGAFDCVTLCRVNSAQERVAVAVAFGASGRRLRAVEQLEFPWEQFAALLTDARRVGPGTYRAEALPFRSIPHESHLVLPLGSQFAAVQGVLTVSCSEHQREALDEALPLLELLANQAAAALDNNSLYATLEQRVRDATATLRRSQDELALARDRAETLYGIARALAGSLDERELLAQGLALAVQALGATRGGIMLTEPTSGRLVFRTTLDGAMGGPAAGLERWQELGGVVLTSRTVALLADSERDGRFRPSAGQDLGRSVLAAPLLLENEPLGVLVLTHPAPGHFQADHGQLALAVASQIAVALSKAQLYRYVSEQSDRLALMLQQREEEGSKDLAILSSIADGVVVCDRLDRIRLINPTGAAMLGIDAADFVGRPRHELPGIPQGAARAETDFTQIEIQGRTLRAHHAPVLSSAGEQLGSVVVYHDLTRETLSDKLKSNFIATASHELRTPLTSIRGYVDLLLLGTIGQLSQPQGDVLKVVKNNISQIVDLLEDILDVSKVEAGEVRLRRASLDMGELVYEVAEALYSQFTERSIALALDVPEDLAPVMADRQRLRQVLINLIGNACKYTTVGGSVDVLLREDGDELRVEVRDTGVGISEEARPNIFTPFFRADNPLRDAVGGTGLGLSITKTLVELHGGRIWFEPRACGGTTFVFTVPLRGFEWTPVEWLDT